jgi:hypothetical protein
VSAPKSSTAIGSVVTPPEAWLATQVAEAILDPARPIVDPHHHLWDRGGHRYLLPELLSDTGSGHAVIATVFVDCVAFYREGGAREMKPLGETEFANGVAAMSASGAYTDAPAPGIVSHADLTRRGGARGARGPSARGRQPLQRHPPRRRLGCQPRHPQQPHQPAARVVRQAHFAKVLRSWRRSGCRSRPGSFTRSCQT